MLHVRDERLLSLQTKRHANFIPCMVPGQVMRILTSLGDAKAPKENIEVERNDASKIFFIFFILVIIFKKTLSNIEGLVKIVD